MLQAPMWQHIALTQGDISHWVLSYPHLEGLGLMFCRAPSLMSVGSLSRKMSGSFTSAWKRASQSGPT